ncbi:hypothetical protein HNY73_009014 [Argiope bruennichi]|uniref:Uncharacterized protein n=1 Tax=Argiope bruennichi TaxID=94029 RepID=A0A8T0FER2_ARGBR|nr:hypothetical protein HNY73_009014 [Argiope bruennichi]
MLVLGSGEYLARRLPLLPGAECIEMLVLDVGEYSKARPSPSTWCRVLLRCLSWIRRAREDLIGIFPAVQSTIARQLKSMTP